MASVDISNYCIVKIDNNDDYYLTLSSNGADIRWYRNGEEFLTIHNTVLGYQLEFPTVYYLLDYKGVEAKFG